MATRKTDQPAPDAPQPDAAATVVPQAVDPLHPGIPDLTAQPQPAPYVPGSFRTIIVNGSTYKTDLAGVLVGRADATGVWRAGVDPADAPTLALHGFPAVVSYDTDAAGETEEAAP